MKANNSGDVKYLVSIVNLPIQEQIVLVRERLNKAQYPAKRITLKKYLAILIGEL